MSTATSNVPFVELTWPHVVMVLLVMNFLSATLFRLMSIFRKKSGESSEIPKQEISGSKPNDEAEKQPNRPTPMAEDAAPWLTLARKEDGTRETPGKSANSRIVQYYADAGHPEVKSDEVAWCAAFVGAMLERSGHPSSKQLTARSYLTWGKALDRPKPGCVAVFWRGSPSSWQGHVGFYVGEDATHVYVLGGNQSNAVNVSKYRKSQVLGYRWPPTIAGSRTYRALALAGAGEALALSGDGIAKIAAEFMPIAAEFKALSGAGVVFQYIGSTITVLALLAIAYARYDDARNKGR